MKSDYFPSEGSLQILWGCVRNRFSGFHTISLSQLNIASCDTSVFVPVVVVAVVVAAVVVVVVVVVVLLLLSCICCGGFLSIFF